MNNLTMGSLFDGIGGFVHAGNQVGIDTLWSSEIDPCCEAVTKHHFPKVVQHGDITKINGAKVEPVDIICGGSPCQDLSVAGKRAGLAGERSGLYMEQIRIIREMRVATNNTYPRYMVWENVPGALSSNKGEDFRAVLEEAARCADKTVSIPESKKWSNAGCIVGNGWSIAWRILDAQFWGVPQRRRRIFLVADFGTERVGEVLFKPESMLWYSKESGEEREGSAADVEGSVGRSSYGVTTKGNGDAFISQERHTSLSGGGGQAGQGYPCVLQENERCGAFSYLMGSKAYNIGYAEEQTPTLRGGLMDTAVCVNEGVFNESGQGYWMPDFGCLRAEGENRPTRPGHCVVQEVKCLNPHDPQTMRVYDANGLYPAITANEGGGQNRQAIIYPDAPIRSLCARANSSPCIDRGQPFVVFTQNQRDEVRDLNGVTASLAAESGMHQTNYICEPVGVFMAGQGAAARTIGYSEDSAPTLKSTNSGGNTVPSVVYPEIAGTICASGAGTNRPAGQGNETELCIVLERNKNNIYQKVTGPVMANTHPGSYSGQDAYNDMFIIAPKSRKYIIRRLTPLECERLQGFKDNWTNITYKNKPMSDSARYRMEGNSVAIPCVVRVLGGIVAQTQNLVSV